jgi:hypothetical protein
MPFVLPPPLEVSSLSIAARLGSSAETITSKPYARVIACVVAELGRSTFWQMKASFGALRASLKDISALPAGWDTYGAEAPNERSRKLASKVLDILELCNLLPDRLSPSAEGGIAFSFVDGDNRAGIEVYNTGEIAAAIWSGQNPPIVWESEHSETALKRAIEQIRACLAS